MYKDSSPSRHPSSLHSYLHLLFLFPTLVWDMMIWEGIIYSYVFFSNPSFPCSSLSHPSHLIFSESLSQSPQLWVPNDFLCTGSLRFCGFLPVPCCTSFLCREDLPLKLRNALWAAPPFFNSMGSWMLGCPNPEAPTLLAALLFFPILIAKENCA